MNKSELKTIYMGLTAQQKSAFHEEAELRGGMCHLGEVLEEAHELGLRPSQRVSQDSAEAVANDSQRVSEGAPVVQLVVVNGGLL